MKSLIHLVFVSLYAISTLMPTWAELPRPGLIKSWSLPITGGIQVFDLSEGPSSTEYALNLLANTRYVSLEQEVSNLKSVLSDMEIHHLDSCKISFVVLEMQEPEIQRRLAFAAAPIIKSNHIEPANYGKLVKNLLNETNAFKKISDCFGSNKKLIVQSCRLISASNEYTKESYGNLKVPYRATVEMSLISMK